MQNTEVLSGGHFRLEKLTLRTETYAGQMSEPVQREVLRSGKAVAVLLYDPTADAFILIRQFRLGAYLNHLEPAWILECVAGMVDEGETAEVTARREVEEETGAEVTMLDRIGEYLTSPGITDELVTIFVALADSSRAGGVHGLASEGEDIQTCVMSVEDALAAADGGAVLNIVAQLALLWFARHGAALRQRWLATVPALQAG